MNDMDCPPLPPTRIYHRADKINGNGSVSALCFKTPRAIDMTRESWAISHRFVSCPKCLALIAGADEWQVA